MGGLIRKNLSDYHTSKASLNKIILQNIPCLNKIVKSEAFKCSFLGKIEIP